MRTGILTFHAALNPGAFMQTLGTVQTLSRLGHEPVVIDYMPRRLRPRPFRKMLSLSTLTPRRWRKAMDRVRLFRAFAPVVATLPRVGPFRSRAEVGREKFDAVVIGSDVVWNFKSKHFGRDPVYFGESLDCGRLVSYAASCGVCRADDAMPAYMTSGLLRFHALSVRDENTRAVVARACGRDATVVPDPTFALDLSGLGVSPDVRGYVLVYHYNPFNPGEIDQVRAFARERGLRTVAVCYRQDWCDENRLAVGPFEWLGLIQQARFVVTGMFHGTIFSIRSGRTIALSMNRAIQSKIEPLMERLRLRSRVIGEDRPLAAILEEPMDYGAINPELAALGAAGQQWLKEALQ